MKSENIDKIAIHIDSERKEKLEMLLARMGIDMETAFNIFICKVVNEEGIPFPISLKHSGPVTKELPDKFNQAGLIARYDADAEKAYLEFPNGSREFI